MATSLQTELNANHQTCAEDADDDVDCEQVVKTALQGGIVYTSRGFSILGVFIFWFLAFFFFLFFVADCCLSPEQMAVGADEWNKYEIKRENCNPVSC